CRTKPNRRQSHRHIKRRPHPHNLDAATRRRTALASPRRRSRRYHRHRVVERQQRMGFALNGRCRRVSRRDGRPLLKGALMADVSPAHASILAAATPPAYGLTNRSQQRRIDRPPKPPQRSKENARRRIDAWQEFTEVQDET